MKKFFGEFKEFVLRGNVMDLAVGLIIGAAFQAVVASLTDNIISPLIGLFTGQNLDGLALEFMGVTLKYGAFITSIINFIIMAFVIFLLVRGMNRLAKMGGKDKGQKVAATKACPYCYTDIPVKATRCSGCTAQLPQEDAAKS